MQEQSTQTDPSQSKDKPLAELLAEAQAKLEQQRDALLRAVADAENARKRAQAEASAAAATSTSAARRLLTAIPAPGRRSP